VIRLALRVRRADADIVLAELLPFAPNGVEQVDDGDVVEYAVYGAPGELPQLGELEAVAGEAFVEVRTTEVADDWGEQWRAFHKPLDIGPMHVRPPWEPEPPSDRLDVVIDPGQAFGTGAHDTTRLCLELLSEMEPGGGFMDLGSGSGVLAVAAAKLGWDPVAAVDHERESVAATAENADINEVTVSVERFDLIRGGPAPTAPTVAANILRPILLAVARAGFDGPPPERLIVSGLLLAEVDGVVEAFARHGLTEAKRLTTTEWAAALLTQA
jgi:ribosomal protein L11 methyltransferase